MNKLINKYSHNFFLSNTEACSYIENKEERINMGKIGRDLAEREFDIEKIVLEHLNIYQLLLKKR